MKKLQEGSVNMWLVLTVVVLVIVVGYFGFIKKPVSTVKPIVQSEIKYKTYENDALGISFEYLEEWGDTILTSQPIDLSKCEEVMMKTYLPNRYEYTDKISFSKRNSDYLYVGLVKFSQTTSDGCDDGGIVNLVEERNRFISQKIGVVEQSNGWKEGVSKNDQGNIFSYYPDYYNGIGTGIDQIYDMFGPNLLVQAWISYGPAYGTPELNEVNQYGCKQDQKYGTCGLTQWLRQGKTSQSLKKDFDGMDHLIKTIKFI